MREAVTKACDGLFLGGCLILVICLKSIFVSELHNKNKRDDFHGWKEGSRSPKSLHRFSDGKLAFLCSTGMGCLALYQATGGSYSRYSAVNF